MGTEESKAWVRRLTEEAWNRGEFGVIDELVAPNYTETNPASPEEVRGAEGFKTFITTIRTAFPDFHLALESMIADGEGVAACWTVRGTHRGEFLGIPPTHRQVIVPGVTVFRIAGGKIMEGRAYWDRVGMLEQLGLAP